MLLNIRSAPVSTGAFTIAGAGFALYVYGMIKIKYENSWYGYQGHDGFALYINGKKMHSGLFHCVHGIREYWANYRLMLCAGVIPAEYNL